MKTLPDIADQLARLAAAAPFAVIRGDHPRTITRRSPCWAIFNEGDEGLDMEVVAEALRRGVRIEGEIQRCDDEAPDDYDDDSAAAEALACGVDLVKLPDTMEPNATCSWYVLVGLR